MKKRLAAMIIFILGTALLLFCIWEWRHSGIERGTGGQNVDPRTETDRPEEAPRLQIAGREETAGKGETAGKDETTGKGETAGKDETTGKGETAGKDETAGKGDAAGEKEEVKKIALTFDDGPHPYYTEQLLDGLKERGVKATFFVTGEHAGLHPDIIRRMQEEGHLIGNHTYSHIQLKDSNQKEFKEELKHTNQIICEITGQETIYVRPPYGSWNKEFEKELNMIPVLWTIDPLDWCSDNVACIVERVVSKAGEGEIILLHDYYETSVTAALCIVDQLLEEGYEFVTVEEILFD